MHFQRCWKVEILFRKKHCFSYFSVFHSMTLDIIFLSMITHRTIEPLINHFYELSPTFNWELPLIYRTPTPPTPIPLVLHIYASVNEDNIGSDNGLLPMCVPSHYLKHCWVIVDWIIRNKFQWNFDKNTKTFHSQKCSWKDCLLNSGQGRWVNQTASPFSGGR